MSTMRRTFRRSTRTGIRRGCGCCGSPRGCAASTGGPRSGRSTRRSAAEFSTRHVTLIPCQRRAWALDDAAFDEGIRAETEEALALTGRDVGTPILHFQPPGGTAFFGPVISRLPSADEAGELWDHVVALAAFPGFAEIT